MSMSGMPLLTLTTFLPLAGALFILLILGIGGFFRSLHFTSLNGLAFADIGQDRMIRASTTSSMV